MSVPKIMLAILILIIAAVGGYHIITYEKIAYDIRKEEAVKREQGTHAQIVRMKKEGLERAAREREGNY